MGITRDIKLFKSMDFSFDDSEGPLTTGKAAQIANEFISHKCKVGYSPNDPKNEEHGYVGSYTCYHWFKEPTDWIEAIIIERPTNI